MKYAHKKLLVLGGFAQHCDAILYAQSQGCYVLVADYLADSPGKVIADEAHLITITDVDRLVELCRDKSVDGVINYCIDPGQKPYQQICSRLGLPCYGTKEQFDVLSNKDQFYNCCLDNGVNVVPRYYVGGNPGNCDLKLIEYPAIVKPADGRASKGVAVCFRPEQLGVAVANALDLSQRKRVVIEKYMNRPEACAKYFVCEGEVFLTSFSDTYTCYVHGERSAINGKYFPSKFEAEFKASADQKLRGMIQKLGIQNGPLSFTCFYDDGVFRFFDPSFRLGGAQQWRIEASITGVEAAYCMTNFALTGSMGDLSFIRKCETDFSAVCAGELFILARLGEIGRIEGVKESAALPSVIGHYVSHRSGDVIRQQGTTDHVVVTYLLMAKSKKELLRDMSLIQGFTKVFDSSGGDMLLPGLDLRIL